MARSKVNPVYIGNVYYIMYLLPLIIEYNQCYYCGGCRLFVIENTNKVSLNYVCPCVVEHKY